MSDNASSMRHTEDKIDSTHFAHHIISPKIYGIVIVLLFILTVLTVLVAYVDFSSWWSLGNLAIALGLATIKATIVTLWFMHVRYSGRLIQITIVTSLMFLMLLIFGTLMDVWTRDNVSDAGYIEVKSDWEESPALGHQSGEGAH